MARDVAGLAQRVHVDTVGHLAGHPQHPRIDRGDIDFGIRRRDRPRAPLRGDEVEIVELAMIPEGSGAKLRPRTSFHREYVIT